jgi:hypothetical protein
MSEGNKTSVILAGFIIALAVVMTSFIPSVAVLDTSSLILTESYIETDVLNVTTHFYPPRIEGEVQPQPNEGELLIWHNPAGDHTYLVYNDPSNGVVKKELIG